MVDIVSDYSRAGRFSSITMLLGMICCTVKRVLAMCRIVVLSVEEPECPWHTLDTRRS